jgi:L-rhamnonate dehydratase
MLGGKVWDKLPVYMTSSNPVNAKNMGFVGAKIPLPYGPADGDNGLLKNIEFVQNWRNLVGPDYPIAIDCYMALTVPYTIKLVQSLKMFNIKWIEEYLPPDDYVGYQ